jgi:regulator of nucleoside diphosphate kinase
MHKKQSRPDIEVTNAQYDRLLELADVARGRSPGAQCLSEELERAKVVGKLGARTVGVNDVVTFEYDGLYYYDVQLVYPKEADFKHRRLSVLTPVGAMLLGLSEGQSIHWYGADKRSHRVSIEKVSKAANRLSSVENAQAPANAPRKRAWAYSGLDLNA